jgi:hypothetical protein
MDSVGNIAAARGVFHKEKSTKKENTKGQLPIGQLYNRTIGEGSTPDTKVNSINDTIDNSSQDPERHKRQRKASEIDDYLFSLVMDGLVAEDFISWHAYCLYTLGHERYHAVVLDLRRSVERGQLSGKIVTSPMKLFAYKLKGRLQLHARQQFYRED